MSSEVVQLEEMEGEEPEKSETLGQAFLIAELDTDEEMDQNQRNQDIVLPVAADGTEAIYSCSSCGVSFLSVLEHIQQFHSDQEVVVEMEDYSSIDRDGTEEVTLLQVLENDEAESQEEKEGQEIIETDVPIIEEVKSDDEVLSFTDTKHNNTRNWKTLHEQQCMDSDGRMYTRKVVQIEKFWEPKETETTDVSDALEDRRAHLEEEVHITDNKDPVISRIYHCVRCTTQYDSLPDFDVHLCGPNMKGVLKYECEHCDATYNNPKSLCAHMKVHKGIKKKPVVKKTPENDSNSYKCEVCETLFPTNKSLRLHSRMHDPIKRHPIEAPVEYKSSKRVIKDESLDGSDGTIDRFHCQLCNKWMHIGYKKVHEMTFHSGFEQFNCEICNRKFYTEENLEMHLTVHNTEKVIQNKSNRPLPYECSYCSRQFSRPHEKVKHERIHTGERPHVCEICGKSFRVSYCLTLHMRTHTGARPYECTHCGKRFKAHSVYKHHILTHSNVRAYKCPYCPKSFKTSVQLAGHKNAHTKPFSCTECNRPFASLYAVRVHMETHKRQNNLKFNCELCGASYARAFALKDHIRSQHLDSASSSSTAQKESCIPEVAAATLSIIPKDGHEDLEVVDVLVEDVEQSDVGEET